MDEARFEHLVMAYGADPARWPADERALAEAFAPAADLAAERELDDALAAFAVEPPSLALRQRILARAPRPRSAHTWRFIGAIGLSGAGLVAACAIGVFVGFDLGGRVGPGARDTDAGFGSVTVFDSPIDAGRRG